MSPTPQKAIANPDVLCTDLPNGEAVLLHIGTQTYYSLNETGAQIWHLINQGLTLSEIGTAIEERYDVSLTQAQQSVLSLTEELAAEKLLSLA
jgi:hypothetical protein